jgi:hypothetical protein
LRARRYSDLASGFSELSSWIMAVAPVVERSEMSEISCQRSEIRGQSRERAATKLRAFDLPTKSVRRRAEIMCKRQETDFR